MSVPSTLLSSRSGLSEANTDSRRQGASKTEKTWSPIFKVQRPSACQFECVEYEFRENVHQPALPGPCCCFKTKQEADRGWPRTTAELAGKRARGGGGRPVLPFCSKHCMCVPTVVSSSLRDIEAAVCTGRAVTNSLFIKSPLEEPSLCARV
jgi:hypothetical protein